ncbi:MAG: acetyltransferase [Ferruginibacter sp.]
MLIIGAGGYAKELLEIFHQKGIAEHLAFYDDVNTESGPLLYNRFPILKNEAEVKKFFTTHGCEFTIGIGNPGLRNKMYNKFTALNGIFTSVISSKACIGSFEVKIGEGCNILDGATFSNSSEAGMGCIAYYNSIITHDCKLGNFVQLSPGATILGGAVINDFALIGSNATILAKLNIGKSAFIAAGALITKSVPDYTLMVGNPARRAGWISEYGDKLVFNDMGVATCKISLDKYHLENENVKKLS